MPFWTKSRVGKKSVNDTKKQRVEYIEPQGWWLTGIGAMGTGNYPCEEGGTGSFPTACQSFARVWNQSCKIKTCDDGL
jgi:hypothetical protein